MSSTTTPRKKLRFRTDFSPATNNMNIPARIEDVLDEPDGIRPAMKPTSDANAKTNPQREYIIKFIYKLLK